MNVVTLPLVHSHDVRPPLGLYVYRRDGRYRGPLWFRRHNLQPGEIDCDSARDLVRHAEGYNLEVRITNSNDDLVYHSQNGTVLHPHDPEDFWRTAAR